MTERYPWKISGSKFEQKIYMLEENDHSRVCNHRTGHVGNQATNHWLSDYQMFISRVFTSHLVRGGGRTNVGRDRSLDQQVLAWHRSPGVDFFLGLTL